MSLDSRIWKTWNEVIAAIGQRPVYLYGRSEDWVPKVIANLGYKPAAIIDSNPALDGGSYKDLLVRHKGGVLPEVLANQGYVVITTGDFEGVAAELTRVGLEPGKDFCCTPEYKDAFYLQRVKRFECSFLFSSPDYAAASDRMRSSGNGGGLYSADIKAGQVYTRKVIDGQFRQIERVGDQLVAVEFNEPAIYFLDKAYRVMNKVALPRVHFCGLAIHEKTDSMYLANSSTDKIYRFSLSDLSLRQEFKVLPKSSDEAQSHHHINDLAISGDSLFVSCFSLSGNWKSSVYDGGVIECSITDTGDLGYVGKIVDNLFMPHSVKFINGSLHLLESALGRFYDKTYAHSVELPGFVRGLEYSDGMYLIGLNETQYMSRLKGIKPYLMMNCGVYVFDSSSCAARFYPFPGNVGIHDIIGL